MINTTYIKPNLLKTINKIAKDNGVSEKKVLNDVIEKGIASITSKEKIEDKIKRLSNGKLKVANVDTYKPNQTVKEHNRMAGVVKAPKGFDPVKAVESIYDRKI
jgi:transcriptional antiterminator